jgi:hypothetical protein
MTPIPKVDYEQKDDGTISLLIPRFKNNFAKKIMIPKNKSPFIKANLDDLGSNTYRLANGERTIYEIAHLLQDQSCDEIEDVMMRVYKFFGALYTNHLIEFKGIINKEFKNTEIDNVKN